MIDLALKAIGYLIQLLKIDATRDKERLEKVVDPLFKDLQAIHDDYNRILGNVIIRVQEHPRSAPKAARTLKEQRQKFEALRETTNIISEEFRKKYKKGEVAKFVSAVAAYFPGEGLKSDPSTATQIVELLEKWNGTSVLLNSYGNPVEDPVGELVEAIEQHLLRQNFFWHSVCESYAKIKAEAY